MAGMNRTDPFIAFGGKIDPISDIRNAGIITSGDVYWVSSPTDSAHTTRTDAYGRTMVKTSIQAAIDQSVNDHNDYVMVIPQDTNTVFAQGTALDLNKDRVKLIGVGYSRAKSSYSVTVRSSQGTVPDTELLAVTGDGCEVAGLRFLGTLGTNAGGTMSNGIVFMGTTSHDFWMHDCIVEDSSAAWGTPPLVRGAGTASNDARFDDCVFTQSGTAVEAAANAPLILGGDGNKRWTFNDCVFKLTAGSTTETIYTPGTGAKEYTMFNRCYFGLVNGTAFAVTSVVRGSVTANNPVLVNSSTTLSFTAIGTDTSVFAAPQQAGTAGAGFHNPGIYALGTGIKVVA